jgi:hypothetical protein
LTISTVRMVMAWPLSNCCMTSTTFRSFQFISGDRTRLLVESKICLGKIWWLHFR